MEDMAEDLLLRISGIVEESIVDGPGIRLVVFTQGCFHGCRGCHNPQTHDPEGGFFKSIEEIADLYATNPLLDGITFSGGEPFLQAGQLCLLAEKIHSLNGDVITYTGYTYEQLIQLDGSTGSAAARLLETSDFLVDGPYVEALRDPDLNFMGSSNQRFLDKNARNKIKRFMMGRTALSQ